MLRNANASHIPGRDIITLEGTDKIEIAHHVSQNFQESFTFSILFQLTTPYQLSFALITKGLPESVTAGKIFMESVNGYLKVWLHDNNNTNSLVVLSNNPIINTNEIIHIAVTWDYTNKILKIYKNAVDVPYTLQTGTGFHTSVSAMGLIRNNSDPMWIGYATGKNAAKIKLFGHMFLAERAWSSAEIDSLYNTIKYTGVYPNQPKIIFSSLRSGDSGFCIYTMNEDGTNQQKHIELGNKHLIAPRWSRGGDYITFLVWPSAVDNLPNPEHEIHGGVYTEGYITDKNGGGGSYITSNIMNGNVYAPSRVIESQDKIYFPRTYAPSNEYRILSRNMDMSNLTLIKNPYSDWTGYNNIAGFDTVDGDTFYYITGPGGNSYIQRYILSTNSTFNIFASTASADVSYRAIRQIAVNRQNTYIGYSYRVNSSSPYHVYVRSLSSLGTPIQITTGTNNCYFFGFTWNGDKVIYSTQTSTPAGTRFQIHTADLDGSNHVNISNSIYNDFYGDSFLFS